MWAHGYRFDSRKFWYFFRMKRKKCMSEGYRDVVFDFIFFFKRCPVPEFDALKYISCVKRCLLSACRCENWSLKVQRSLNHGWTLDLTSEAHLPRMKSDVFLLTRNDNRHLYQIWQFDFSLGCWSLALLTQLKTLHSAVQCLPAWTMEWKGGIRLFIIGVSFYLL